MLLGTETRRFILERVRNTPPDLLSSTQYFKLLGMETGSLQTTLKSLGDKLENEVTSSQMRNYWRASELVRFFSQKHSLHTVAQHGISSSQVRKKMKEFISSNEELISLQIFSKPQILLLGKVYQKISTIRKKMTSIDSNKDYVFWIPDHGLLLSHINEDDEGQQFFADIQQYITGNAKEFRINAMSIMEYYMDTKIIERVRVSSVAEITGFNGLYHFQFQGDDVKRGAYGLSQRQEVDIRKLSSVGPTIEVESNDLHLYIGNEIRIKSLMGIEELVKIIEKK